KNPHPSPPLSVLWKGGFLTSPKAACPQSENAKRKNEAQPSFFDGDKGIHPKIHINFAPGNRGFLTVAEA
ncbi:MAG: hypothetical protein K2K75_07860, partial [Muribaculaceae bacterium]|nr:hypothetical protein [Muribaculaceae bacterium]